MGGWLNQVFIAKGRLKTGIGISDDLLIRRAVYLFSASSKPTTSKPKPVRPVKAEGCPNTRSLPTLRPARFARRCRSFAVPFVGLVGAFGQGAVEQGGAVFGAVQEDDDAAVGLLDALKGFGQRPGMARVGLDEVHDAEGFVYADEGFGVGGGFAFDEGEVGFAGEFVDVNVLLEFAPRGLYGALPMSSSRLSVRLRYSMRSVIVPILRLCSSANFISSGMRAMVPSSLMISQITAAGMSPFICAKSTPASVCPARTRTPPFAHAGEDVAGLDDVFGFGGRGDGGLDGQGAVGGGNAGGDALRRFDGNGEVGAVLRAVFLGHHGQAEPLDHAAFHRQANQSARVFDHEVDGFGGDELCRHQQIASFSRSSASVMITILPALMSARISGMEEMWGMVRLS